MAGEVLREEDRKEIIAYMQAELNESESEREKLEGKWEIWRRHAEARPEKESKDFPWKKASNIAVPLTQTNHAGIYATMKAKYGNTKPLMTVSTDDEQRQKQAEVLSEWLNFMIESKFHLNMREINNTLFYNLSLLGTQFVRIPWLKDMYSFKRHDENGNLKTVEVTKHEGPAVIPIRIEDFFTRTYNHDIQRAPWIATRSYLMWHELKQREVNGIYENVDKIRENYAKIDDNRERSMQRQGVAGKKEMKDVYEIFQANVFWDIDGDGIPEDVIIFFERESGVILREELNELGFREIVRIPYLPRPNELYGMGVGWLCEYIQQEVDTLHNVRIDGSILSAFPMFATRRGCGIGPKEKFFPLKNIMVDDPAADIVPFKFYDIGPTTMQAEMMAREYADQATGATNALMGQPDSYAKTRATASGTMFLAQQSSRLFNAISENLEAGLGEIGLYVILQAIQHKTELKLDMLSDEKQAILNEVLSMEIEDIHLAFNFKVTATDIDQTEEAKRQRLLTLMQLYQMYGSQMLGLIQSNMQILMQVNPQMAMPSIKQYQEFASQFIVGGTKLMGKVLDFFETEHKGYLPYVKEIEMMLNLSQMIKEQQLMGGMNGNTGNYRQTQVGNGGAGQGNSRPVPGTAGGPEETQRPPSGR